jgi:hypothetical protein
VGPCGTRDRGGAAARRARRRSVQGALRFNGPQYSSTYACSKVGTVSRFGFCVGPGVPGAERPPVMATAVRGFHPSSSSQ